MEDRVSTYPGRVRLTPVSGQTNVYDLERADQPTEVGTPLNKANLLTDAVAEFLNLPTTATPNDAFKMIGAELVFEDITTSGTWTVPQNICGNKIFVIVVGGGASGYAGTSTGSTSWASGGGSGELNYGTMEVTPGQNITAIIGAGGQPATSSSTESKPGGTSSFGNISANGGNGSNGGAGGGGYMLNGQNGTFGGGGGMQNYQATGGNGGTYGGGGGVVYGDSVSKGGTYGGNGGSSGTYCEAGDPYLGSMKLWNLASDYYGLPRPVGAKRKPNAGIAVGYKMGGGGLGSCGGSSTSSIRAGGGGGFLANGSTTPDANRNGGGGLFGYTGTVNSSGGQGFYSAGGSVLRGAGGEGGNANKNSGAGGNGVVAIWYYAYQTIKYFNEIY